MAVSFREWVKALWARLRHWAFVERSQLCGPNPGPEHFLLAKRTYVPQAGTLTNQPTNLTHLLCAAGFKSWPKKWLSTEISHGLTGFSFIFQLQLFLRVIHFCQLFSIGAWLISIALKILLYYSLDAHFLKLHWKTYRGKPSVHYNNAITMGGISKR